MYNYHEFLELIELFFIASEFLEWVQLIILYNYHEPTVAVAKRGKQFLELIEFFFIASEFLEWILLIVLYNYHEPTVAVAKRGKQFLELIELFFCFRISRMAIL